MQDLKYIRENTSLVKIALRNKGSDTAPVDELLACDEDRRRLLHEVEQMKHALNETSQEISRLKKAGQNADENIIAMRDLSGQIKSMDQKVRLSEERMNALLLSIPNTHHASVPVGASEAENIEVRRKGEPPTFSFQPKPHWEVGERLGIIDFDRGVKISGARFYVLKGLGARLERAIISFMIDYHVNQHGYSEIYPPVLVRSECMVGTGQLPKFGEDAFHCELDDLWLVPTAEVPVTNLYRNEILDFDMLPICHVAFSPCFRREAGAAGKDTRGMVRVHQFDKVEMVKFVEPEKSYEELEALLGNAEAILQALGLHYRIVEICTGDLGFTAAKKYDPEVWFPGQNRFVEISSCSNFEDFQSRRANIRYRPGPGAKPRFVHTLNGSGLAVGRTFAAILENYQNEDGTVNLPPILRPYMGGVEKIE
ncbi:MAG: serine--tRNA ligase [Armatimonadetes bacterium CG2_30_59_28]|nr:MAG: serine--tRNA ligase [Armatimonadetes bacterium CG2_30_59_28]PIU63673.1 MAG: serine--tRNA ligase [Armatimonadetes bacterium CG07_land_8_20_14_0_80_59_28]PIX41869.1 MAG: serine--tRNA ligase [Armatimonadetes bacterium CG_4_8_14_3_um_filter_58_9]PIY48773.1 MAG: serine--tRNA ligase [Armatimonadetes bacterium CG_4_10_14_3_um_filter_59_10]PJB67472.1 MAG: serine--tRNA ligase [Armatimonadetes bacterium CG_4_9_14_3_um_filter_58_7]